MVTLEVAFLLGHLMKSAFAVRAVLMWLSLAEQPTTCRISVRGVVAVPDLRLLHHLCIQG